MSTIDSSKALPHSDTSAGQADAAEEPGQVQASTGAAQTARGSASQGDMDIRELAVERTNTQGALNRRPEPMEPAATEPTISGARSADENQEEELGFIRSGLAWLRENVATNGWLRAAVSIGSFLFPPLFFVSMALLALDVILILDKLIAGEKLTLRDFSPILARIVGSIFNSEAVNLTGQLLVAGFDLWSEWKGSLSKYFRPTSLPNEREVHQMILDADASAARIRAGNAGTADSVLVDRIGQALMSIEAHESKLAVGPGNADERQSLNLMRDRLLEALGKIEEARKEHPSVTQVLVPGMSMEPATA